MIINIKSKREPNLIFMYTILLLKYIFFYVPKDIKEFNLAKKY